MASEAQKIELETDKVSVEVEHEVGLLTLGLVCLVLWAPCWWYDDEIRCALGNQKMCAKIQIEKPKTP